VVKSTSTSSKGATSMAELMKKVSSKMQTLQKGQIVEGTVKKLTPQEILLDIGAKGDALVIEYDKQNLANLLNLLKVGDKVRASVISVESEEGYPVVSLRRMLDSLMYDKLLSKFKNEELVTGVIAETTRGGFFVQEKEGVRGFLPHSQVLSTHLTSETEVKLKIIECDIEKKRVIFSEKATVYTTNLETLSQLFKTEQKVKGVVESVTPHGVYIRLEADGKTAEGFVHISEVSYQRVENLESLYKKGDSIEAVVNDIDRENHRVNLSVKKLTTDTFSKVKENYPKDKQVTGKVTDVKSRGVTVVLEEGVNGFIQTSKIPSGTTYEVGQIISCTVSDIDEKKRLVLLVPVMTTKFIGYR